MAKHDQHMSPMNQSVASGYGKDGPLATYGTFTSLQSPYSYANDISVANGEEEEIPQHVVAALQEFGLSVSAVGVVDWSNSSPHHPRKWSLARKFYDTFVIIALEFFMTLMSNAGTSIAQNQPEDVAPGVSTGIATAAFTTLYLAGQAIGSLVFPPIAESYGSQAVYAACCLGFTVCSFVNGAVGRVEMVFMARFVEGMLSAMPAVVAAGSIENLWDMRARIWVFHIWVASSVVGLSLGPLLSTYVGLSSLGWRWVFYISGVVGSSIFVLSLFMKESRPSQRLHQLIRRVSHETRFKGLVSAHGEASLTLREFMQTSLALPLRLFFTEPIVFTISLMSASVYSLAYLFTEALGVVYTDGFLFSPQENALVFLAFGIGACLSILPRLFDVRIVSKRRQQAQDLTPEDKLFGFFISAPVLAAGLWWFAWTVPPLVHVTPWASIAALCLMGYCFVEFDNVLSGYLTDVYASFAGSANAPLAFLRAVLSGAFPLFGTQLFNLGPNWVLTALAVLATGYCGVAIWFGVHGKTIRERSPFAQKTWRKEIIGRTESLTGLISKVSTIET